MRCDCTNTFVSLETGDPEEQSAELNDGTISIEVRLTRNCSECGSEKKEYTFSMEQEIQESIDAHNAKFHPDAEQKSDLTLDMDYDTDESGGGRYKKNMISVNANYNVTCDDCTGDDAVVASGTITDSCAAGDFEEL